MAYPNSFLRLTLHFTLPGSEVADTSLSWNPDDALVSLDESTAAQLSGRADTFWTDCKDQFAPETKYVGSSVFWVAPDGHTLARIDSVVSPVAGGGTGTMPNEVATVMSLRTNLAGRRYRGRMYLPALAKNKYLDTARMSPAACDDISLAGAALCADLTVGLVTYTAVVASATGSVMTPIVAVAVGDVPDAQRRRRDAMLEQYYVNAVT